MRQMDLTQGSIVKSLLIYAWPVVLSSLLQSAYSITDLIVAGWFIGEGGISAINNASQVMQILTQIIMGITTGGNILMSQYYGSRDPVNREKTNRTLFFFSVTAGAVMTVAVLVLSRPILIGLRAPALEEATAYLTVCALGLIPIFGYNALSAMLRSVGNSRQPFYCVAVTAGVNIVLDCLFMGAFHWGVRGAALATVLSQYLAGVGLALYTWKAFPALRVGKEDRYWSRAALGQLLSLSGFTCLQQSVMNFGILLVQGLVNSFGTTVMAAFSVAVKIDTLAYMPVQDFGNAFSTFVAQNFGAQKRERIRRGTRWAVFWVVVFCLAIGGAVCLLAPRLMAVFVGPEAAEVIAVGTGYLRIEGAFYLGIGVLFLLYGYFRAVNRPGVSVVLTVCSLGTRVALAYVLSALPALGVTGIWMAIPIGWFFADLVGILLWRREDRQSRCPPPAERPYR